MTSKNAEQNVSLLQNLTTGHITFASNCQVDVATSIHMCLQGSLYYQSKQCIVIREIPPNCHRFVLFDSPKMGNLMTSVS